jgi:hypothetical protein
MCRLRARADRRADPCGSVRMPKRKASTWGRHRRAQRLSDGQSVHAWRKATRFRRRLATKLARATVIGTRGVSDRPSGKRLPKGKKSHGAKHWRADPYTKRPNPTRDLPHLPWCVSRSRSREASPSSTGSGVARSGPIRTLVAQQLLEHRNHFRHALQIRVDVHRAMEEFERSLCIAEPQIDLACTGQCPEVLRIAL